MDTSKAVERLYWFTSLPVKPTTYIMVPSLLNAWPFGKLSWLLTSKVSTWLAVDTSKAVDNVYSATPAPVEPETNILVPSLLNERPTGVAIEPEVLKLSTKDAPAIVFDVAPFETVNVASSFTVPMLSAATGALLLEATVKVMVPTS